MPELNGFKKRKQYIIPQSTNPVNEDGVSECFQTFNTLLYVSLAPIHITNPINGIKAQHLDPLIMNYFPKTQGVVVSYSNVKLLDEKNDEDVTLAKVSDSSPFTFSWISVDLLVWRPQIGDTLEGYIYMQTASHIGLLIHDTFNASIKKFNIPPDWNFIPSQIDESEDNEDGEKFKSMGYWVDENEIKIEGRLKFTVKNIHSSGRFVSIDGTLIKPGNEEENQPVFKNRRTSLSNDQFQALQSQPGTHKKFDDVEEEELPKYDASDNEDAIINNSEDSD